SEEADPTQAIENSDSAAPNSGPSRTEDSLAEAEPPTSATATVDTVVFDGREYCLNEDYYIVAEMIGEALGKTDDGRQAFACLTDETVILVLTENGFRAFG
ncbi:MAG: hypothetical protein IK118_02725, partial [Clostridia bacterium]|nr:hypothetical protein [Clostridia bacterium]